MANRSNTSDGQSRQASAQKRAKPNRAVKSDSQIVKRSAEGLHKRNKHRGRYDFDKLVAALPALAQYVIKNPRGDKSISFDNPKAVTLLNQALLKEHYGIENWQIPEGFLCPPIPGRADYIHRIADLVQRDLELKAEHSVRALDIGVGANCIYPIIGTTEYDWSCVGSDVDPVSIKAAQWIVDNNARLKDNIELRLQDNAKQIFKGIIKQGETFTVTTCNPPFHKSLADAQEGTLRKQKNLNINRSKRGVKPAASANGLNFGGQKAELWCPGGEEAFVLNMANESQGVASNVVWFSTLISKKENVRPLRKRLELLGACDIVIQEMAQGQKKSRFVAWSFHDQRARRELAKKVLAFS
jgi:23S rRNA (adenine1618-N6)-methyltransferase